MLPAPATRGWGLLLKLTIVNTTLFWRGVLFHNGSMASGKKRKIRVVGKRGNTGGYHHSDAVMRRREIQQLRRELQMYEDNFRRGLKGGSLSREHYEEGMGYVHKARQEFDEMERQTLRLREKRNSPIDKGKLAVAVWLMAAKMKDKEWENPRPRGPRVYSSGSGVRRGWERVRALAPPGTP